MKRIELCSTLKVKAEAGCHVVKDIQTVQSFPTRGLLYENLNRTLAELECRISSIRGTARSYIVDTVKMRSDKEAFEQHGSGPNFQGDVLTLCTCKHQMRSRLSVEEWEKDVWIAGFTSRTIHQGRHWLFYLARFDSAHDSHSDLWRELSPSVRKAKVADSHFLGDIFRPKTPPPTGNFRFTPSRYVMPKVHAHRTKRNPNGWHNDIEYRHSLTDHLAPLLVADPELTFLWKKPLIRYVPQKHCRDYHTWDSIQDVIKKLR